MINICDLNIILKKFKKCKCKFLFQNLNVISKL